MAMHVIIPLRPMITHRCRHYSVASQRGTLSWWADRSYRYVSNTRTSVLGKSKNSAFIFICSWRYNQTVAHSSHVKLTYGVIISMGRSSENRAQIHYPPFPLSFGGKEVHLPLQGCPQGLLQVSSRTTRGLEKL